MKKVTIKFFLKKQLKPNALGNFPLYIKITYDRRNTEIRSYFDIWCKEIDKAWNQYADLLKFEENQLRKLIEYELSRVKSFNLKGISKKHYLTLKPLHQVSNFELNKELYKILSKTNDKQVIGMLVQDYHFDTKVLYTVASKILNDFDSLITDDFLSKYDCHQRYLSLMNIDSNVALVEVLKKGREMPITLLDFLTQRDFIKSKMIANSDLETVEAQVWPYFENLVKRVFLKSEN